MPLSIWLKKRFPRLFRSRHFELRLSPGTFFWCCPLGLRRISWISCSGAYGATTSLPPSILFRIQPGTKYMLSQAYWAFHLFGSHLRSTCQPSRPLQGWSMAWSFPLARPSLKVSLIGRHWSGTARYGSAYCLNSQPRKWLKPNCFAIDGSIDLTKEALPSSF